MTVRTASVVTALGSAVSDTVWGTEYSSSNPARSENIVNFTICDFANGAGINQKKSTVSMLAIFQWPTGTT